MQGEVARRATLAWLSRREPPAPFELERRLRRALERLREPADTVPHTLAAAAIQCLRDAARVGDKRGAANDLLAADALLTYAFEAAAEEGIDVLAQLTSEFDSARFEALARDAAQ